MAAHRHTPLQAARPQKESNAQQRLECSCKYNVLSRVKQSTVAMISAQTAGVHMRVTQPQLVAPAPLSHHQPQPASCAAHGPSCHSRRARHQQALPCALLPSPPLPSSHTQRHTTHAACLQACFMVGGWPALCGTHAWQACRLRCSSNSMQQSPRRRSCRPAGTPLVQGEASPTPRLPTPTQPLPAPQ